MVGGHARLAMWRPAPPLRDHSPVEGSPEGVRLRADGGGPTRADVQLGGGPLAAGTYALSLHADATGAGPITLDMKTPGGGASVTATPGVRASLGATIVHPGGPLRLDAIVQGNGSLWVTDVALDAR
jgi:hypothetical protein